ncbi:gliding motility-associated C-terminal domain-containing protein [Segetibacter sp.]|uniref:T9SS type B sorting domain-containing protein n=1 Tax=Segetibacter sp. TaxID=2231182 RepID=UPI0026381C72|nr:gliding motility-associated C-terminal domain-containing protein [Segetibacter sp.]MCW3081802.1 hypothetical protein [Segetibacter sp.]
MVRVCLFIFFVVISFAVQGQTCTNPGQNPTTAFPVCGTSKFVQNTVPSCGGRSMPSVACRAMGLTDINPFWYKFTCFKAGTLGFEITPNNLNDDYDWEIYDVTGRNANDVYTDGNIVVSSNWSGETGKTGASAAGTQGLVCGGRGRPLYSSMPSLIAGHNYLMLVSHFTRTQSGYSLSFNGGTGVITDTAQPRLKAVQASCGGDVLRLVVNKKIKCSSISADGSDFSIANTAATISSAASTNCAGQFDTDTIELKLSQFLAPGNYTLRIGKGADANTLLDYCDNSVPETDEINFTIQPKAPTPIDSIAPIQCRSSKVSIILSRPVLCSSIATDGSDFSISGSYPVTITNVTKSCSLTNEIVLTLSAPLERAGTFSLNLIKGSDGNTILNQCGEETLAGPTLTFSVKDTVNADFTYNVKYGCNVDQVQYRHSGANGVNRWNWQLDENNASSEQNPLASYQAFTNKTVTLAVSNGFCTDTSSNIIELNNFLKADFSVLEDNCPNEPLEFRSTAVGKIVNHSWSFGDGGIAKSATPTHTYAAPNRQTPYTVRYTVIDSFGCQSNASKTVTIYAGCFLAVPNAFTPNGDGLNDLFHPLNAVKAEQLEFKVFNRWGQLLYKTSDWRQGWNGTWNGNKQATGTYIWTLKYVNRETKETVNLKGTTVLIR